MDSANRLLGKRITFRRAFQTAPKAPEDDRAEAARDRDRALDLLTRIVARVRKIALGAAARLKTCVASGGDQHFTMVRERELEYYSGWVTRYMENDRARLEELWNASEATGKMRRVLMCDFNVDRLLAYGKARAVSKETREWVEALAKKFSTPATPNDVDVLTLYFVGHQITEDL